MPVLNETAQRWLSEGLRGGHSQFLGQPSHEDSWQAPSSRKEIGGRDSSSQDLPSLDPSSVPLENYTLEHMKMGLRDSYICLIPKPPVNTPSAAEDEAESELSPARSWSLLQPLTGTCLYHRQGWFTYSYCHNRDIRQFKELIQAHPHHSTGGYKPEEDPEWEAYTLGRAPTNPELGADLTVAEQNAHAVNLELARNAGSRYLVQRWGEGTICDKTGKSREVEVQFHCSMAMTDTILFVKETKTCSYVLVVHTPRLCGEPGFKSRLDSSGEAQIQCREIIPDSIPRSDTTSTATSASDTEFGQAGALLPVTDHPLKLSRHKTVPPSPPLAKKEKPKGTQDDKKDSVYGELLRQTLEALVEANIRSDTARAERIDELLADDNSGGGEVIIQLLEDDGMMESREAETMDRLTEALRAAGYDVKTERMTAKTKNAKGGQNQAPATEQQDSADDTEYNHVEL
ncbi:hypothetical protein AX17_003465 [Amanita inopinata Kibby_2008]|nr:hypothetical protein AX17_003465 [Amanita inopinata Kibby_2008]